MELQAVEAFSLPLETIFIASLQYLRIILKEFESLNVTRPGQARPGHTAIQIMLGIECPHQLSVPLLTGEANPGRGDVNPQREIQFFHVGRTISNWRIIY